MNLEVNKIELPKENELKQMNKEKLLELYDDISKFISYLESMKIEESEK